MPRGKTIFYKQGHFWGAFGSFLCLYCTGMGFAWSGHLMPAHWMFGLAALFGVISVVIVALSRRVNKAIEVAALVVVISGLLLSDAWATGWIKAAIGEGSVLGRVRVTNIEAIPAEQNPLKVPALTFFYDNAGTGKIRGVSYRFAVAITDGLMPEEKVVQEQNRLVLWSGWQAAMKRRQDVELRPVTPVNTLLFHRRREMLLIFFAVTLTMLYRAINCYIYS